MKEENIKMKNIIILKGEPNSGKSETLKDYLPPLLSAKKGQRAIIFREENILIIRRSIHESHDWKKVIEKIINCEYKIIVIAAWLDNLVQESVFIKKTLENILGNRGFIFHQVSTTKREKIEDRNNDHHKCAKEIMNHIDAIISKKIKL